MANLQDHIQTLRLYTELGLEPGSCTRAILANDLHEACAHADQTTQYLLMDIMRYVVNSVPRDAWGSYEKVAAWIKQGGVRGRQA